MSKIITIEEINSAAVEVAYLIKTEFPKGIKIRLFGIPRGGVPAVYAVCSELNKLLPPSRRALVVQDSSAADVFIDDLIDSGRTRTVYRKKYPATSFYALFRNPPEWFIFPWEISTPEDTSDKSADDIPIRLLQYVGEDVHRGGLKETPNRFLKAWKHFTSGYSKVASDVLKVFENGAESYDEIVLVKNIPVYSQCEHHLVPFFGVAHIGYIPDGKIVGLSKLSRVVEVYARRLQVQERLTNQIADALHDNLEPLGVAVVIECRHLCMEARGISQQGQITVTSAMRGAFRDEGSARTEFLSLINEAK